MKLLKETLRETGKFFYDLAKISVGLGLILPFLKGESLSPVNALLALVSALVFFVVGIILINKGGRDE